MKKKISIGIIALGIVCSLVFAVSIKFFLPAEEEPMIVQEFQEQPKIPLATFYEYKFGRSKDSLIEKEEKVSKNETFIQILRKNNISKDEAQNIINKSKGIFDFKKIHSGSEYTVYKTPDSSATTKFIVYEPNHKETIILKMDDSISIIKEEKKLFITKKSIGGVIKNSLYETMAQQNIPVQLAYELSKMFNTKVDFFKINKGDNFKIIYDEVSLEGSPIGVDKIYSASFEHDHQRFYAINLNADGKDEYYDEKGESLKKGFLKAPLKFFRITSRYTQKRFHPVQKVFKAHLGTDYAAPTGTPILSVGNGIVLEAKYGRFNGNYVKIKHNSTYTTQYLHMSKIAAGMKPGKKISQGQIIGYVGSTGLSSGPHVCFRFWQNGKQVDPKSVKGTISEPLPKNKLKTFAKTRDQQLLELGKIKI